MGAIGSLVAVLFGVFWTISAAGIGAPIIFPLFGFIFILLGTAQMIYHFKNATGQNRFSAFDITDNREETDPLDKYLHPASAEQRSENLAEERLFCPYCGANSHSDHIYCPKCGKKLT
jgi:hypothetical protein